MESSESVQTESIVFSFVGLKTFSGGHKNDIDLPLQQKSHCLNETKKSVPKPAQVDEIVEYFKL